VHRLRRGHHERGGRRFGDALIALVLSSDRAHGFEVAMAVAMLKQALVAAIVLAALSKSASASADEPAAAAGPQASPVTTAWSLRRAPEEDAPSPSRGGPGLIGGGLALTAVGAAFVGWGAHELSKPAGWIDLRAAAAALLFTVGAGHAVPGLILTGMGLSRVATAPASQGIRAPDVRIGLGHVSAQWSF
jgi:hypothetical protein